MVQPGPAQLQVVAVVVPAAPDRGLPGWEPLAKMHRLHLIPAPLPRRSGMTGPVLRPEKLLPLPAAERRV